MKALLLAFSLPAAAAPAAPPAGPSRLPVLAAPVNPAAVSPAPAVKAFEINLFREATALGKRDERRMQALFAQPALASLPDGRDIPPPRGMSPQVLAARMLMKLRQFSPEQLEYMHPEDAEKLLSEVWEASARETRTLLRRDGSAPTLASLLADAPPKRVLDFGAGDGGWLERAEGAPWLAPRARLRGLEKPTPDHYRSSPSMLPAARWDKRRIVTTDEWERRPRLLPDGGFDLVHEGFITPGTALEKGHFETLARLVRPGGALLVAHTDAFLHGGVPHEWVMDALAALGWERRLFRLPGVPEDYPGSYWWDAFAANGPEDNYLVFARKPK